jgi:hypothetical protein
MHLIDFCRDHLGLELITFRLFLIFFVDLFEKPFAVVDIELILESVTVHVVFLEMKHRIEEIVL